MNGKLTFKDVFFKGAVLYNPVLVQCVGLCPVIIATSTLKDAALLAGILFVNIIVNCLLANTVLKRLPRYLRVAIYLIIGLAISCPVLWYIDAHTVLNLSLGMKIYIPLIAANSVTALHCEQFSVKNPVSASFFDAFAAGTGTGGILILCGALREILGLGTLGGMDLDTHFRISGMTMPFGCIITLGFLAAILRFLTLKFREVQDEIIDEPEFPEAAVREEIPEIIKFDSAADNTSAPEEVDLSFADDDYLDVLSSVDELIEKYSRESGGEDE